MVLLMLVNCIIKNQKKKKKKYIKIPNQKFITVE
jgi:hypothetical protein